MYENIKKFAQFRYSLIRNNGKFDRNPQFDSFNLIRQIFKNIVLKVEYIVSTEKEKHTSML